MVDLFEEVDEQIRSQRFESLLRRAWPFAAAAAGVVVIGALGIWGWSRHEADEESKASVAYQAAMQTASRGDLVSADRAFSTLGASAPAGYRSLSLMQDAQVKLLQKKPQDAVRLLDEAAKIAPDVVIGDAARLKAAYLVMDHGSLAEVESRLQPLTAVKAPYRAMALEALAMARLQAGKLAEAKNDFQVLLLTQDVAEDAQNRARAAVALIDSGGARSLPAVVKAAEELPPEKAALARLAAQAAARGGAGGASGGTGPAETSPTAPSTAQPGATQ